MSPTAPVAETATVRGLCIRTAAQAPYCRRLGGERCYAQAPYCRRLDGVMVAATNFCQNLDPAIMRRFTFKLEFDYLDDAGKKSFFEHLFATQLTDAEFDELKALRNLSPGDFRTVRQELFYLGTTLTNHDRIAALRTECQLKKDGEKRNPIGFAA